MKRKNNKIDLFDKFILFFNFLSIFALFISYSAGYVKPTTLWVMPFFSLAYPFILIVNLFFVIYWTLNRKKYLFISLITILIGYNNLTSTFGFRGKTANNYSKDSSDIKIMTYNVHFFKQFSEKLDAETRTNIFKLIEEENPDIIGFQEFFTRYKGKYLIKDSICKILNSKNYYFIPSMQNDYEASGIAIFSKLPIVNKGDLSLLDPNGSNKGLWVDIKKNDKVFRVHVVHLTSYAFQPEDYNYYKSLTNSAETTDKDIKKGIRIIRMLKNGFVKRTHQVDILKNYTDTCSKPYIIMGDFNDTPVSYTFKNVKGDMQSTFQKKGSGMGITYNGDFPNFQIDHILASKEFDIKTHKIIKKTYSDHYPVSVILNLKN